MKSRDIFFFFFFNAGCQRVEYSPSLTSGSSGVTQASAQVASDMYSLPGLLALTPSLSALSNGHVPLRGS